MPRQRFEEQKQILTETLDSLPHHSIIADCYGDVWQKISETTWVSTHGGQGRESDAMWQFAPMTLVDTGQGYTLAYEELRENGDTPTLRVTPGAYDADVTDAANTNTDTNTGTNATDTEFTPDYANDSEAVWRRTPDEPERTPQTASTTTVTARTNNARNIATYPSIAIYIDSRAINDDIVDDPDAHNLHSTAVSTSISLTRKAASTLVAQLAAALRYQED